MAFVGKRLSVNAVVYTPQSALPSNPIEGQMFYSDGTAAAEGLYVYKNTIWQKIGNQVGNINYIQNPDAESGITSWNEYDDGASATPVDGTGGTAANITLSANTTTPLRGAADFKIAKAAADAQGEGVSYDFAIDNADKLKNLTVSFDYNVTSNYADSDIGIYIYDVTNAAIINLGTTDLADNANNAVFTSTFTATNSTFYRLIFHVQSTNALAYDIQFDNVIVGVITANATESSVVAAKLTVTGTVNHTSSGNWQVINFNTTEIDTASMVSGSTIVIPETAYYLCIAGAGFASGVGSAQGVRFTINGTSDTRSEISGATVTLKSNVQQLYYFSAGDVIRAEGLQVSGGTVAYDNSFDTFLNVIKLK